MSSHSSFIEPLEDRCLLSSAPLLAAHHEHAVLAALHVRRHHRPSGVGSSSSSSGTGSSSNTVNPALYGTYTGSATISNVGTYDFTLVITQGRRGPLATVTADGIKTPAFPFPALDSNRSINFNANYNGSTINFQAQFSSDYSTLTGSATAHVFGMNFSGTLNATKSA